MWGSENVVVDNERCGAARTGYEALCVVDFDDQHISHRGRGAPCEPRKSPLAFCLLALPAIVNAQGSPRMHDLKASPTTVHRGFFDASLKPVLTIDSGDIVRLETATGNPRWFEKLGVPKDKIPAELYEVFKGVEGDGRGDHTLNGPIAIRGAEPGDMLEIRIRSVDVRLPIAGQSFARIVDSCRTSSRTKRTA